MKTKPKLIILVGIPASGKSEYAKTLLNDNTILLSSDSLRKALLGSESDQSNNELVFSTLYKRAKALLIEGKNVIIDATNVSMKDRKRTLCNFQKLDIERIAIFMATPYEVCIERDLNRNRTVGERIIMKFVYKFEIPMEFEGFDKIEKITFNKQYYNINDIILKMNDFDQKTPHHKYTLGVHCYKFSKLAGDNTLLSNVGLLHDIGKLYTQTFDEKGVAHYYQHHNVGAYILSCLDLERDIVFYVNYHMHPFNWKEQKTHDKYKELFGETYYNNLILLNKFDKEASGRNE